MSVEIRPARPGEEAAVNRVIVRTWKTAYRGLVDPAYLAAMEEADPTRIARFGREITAGRVLAAVADSTLVGLAVYGPARQEPYLGQGELYALYILKEYQQTGIGGRLIHTVKQALSLAGFRRMVIGCFSENPARNFYEKTGGRAVEQKTCAIGGREYGETIFQYDLAGMEN